MGSSRRFTKRNSTLSWIQPAEVLGIVAKQDPDPAQHLGSIETKAIGHFSRSLSDGVFRWLGDRDSNPNYLIQSQAFYR